MPADLRVIREARLNSEHRELSMLNGDVIKIEPLGPKPYASYRLTFNIRTIIAPRPLTFQSCTVCILDLPEGFPHAMPRLHIDPQSGSRVPWHVNWYKGGTWCAGSWSIEESLANYIYRCAKTLQFDPNITNPDNPANDDAVSFWNENKSNRSIIPCDTQLLPTLDVLKPTPQIVITRKEKPKITIH